MSIPRVRVLTIEVDRFYKNINHSNISLVSSKDGMKITTTDKQEQLQGKHGCLFCTGIESSRPAHSRSRCPVFRSLKSRCSKIPYIARQLEERDAKGYAAAGILLWRRFGNNDAEFLMAREYRHGNDLLNFLGGKRLREDMKAIECATNKVDSETGHQLSKDSLDEIKSPGGCPLVVWSCESKYVLFIFEVTNEGDKDIDIRALGIRGKHVKRLEWITRSELRDEKFISAEIHEYTFDLIRELILNERLNFFERLFEVCKAKKPNNKEVPSMNQTKHHYFDVISNISQVAAIACPDNPPLTNSATWDELRQTVESLHFNDIQKLQRKFDPNCFSRYVNREPTTEEMILSALCKSVFDCLKTNRSYVDSKMIEEAQDNLRKLNNMLRFNLTNDEKNCHKEELHFVDDEKHYDKDELGKLFRDLGIR